MICEICNGTDFKTRYEMGLIMNRRVITYAIDSNGFVWSRVGDEIAFPELYYDGMKPENNWEMNYNLKKDVVLNVCFCSDFKSLTWTKKIPKDVKNLHRRFWGLKALK